MGKLPRPRRTDRAQSHSTCLMLMKTHFLRCAASSLAILVCTSYHLCRGSDHADPQSVTNPFYVQPEPDANITDLHAFIVERLVGENNQVIEGEHLIVSLCVRRE